MPEQGSRPARAAFEATAAIRADAVQAAIDAGRAKRAFERADHGIDGIRRQASAAAFAVCAEFEHGSTSHGNGTSIALMRTARNCRRAGGVRSPSGRTWFRRGDPQWLLRRAIAGVRMRSRLIRSDTR
ncbi:hypothetical protein GCM10009105_23190 [Dokdonella soli]|uniref:Uncharacterized protein n=1 Tax=Dokdonella soli TaxID=529810 RepID=A0ABN1IL53_9GAMM